MKRTIYYEVVNVDNEGITLKHPSGNLYIRFDECARNYAAEKSLETSRCVATRDVTKLSFTFYTSPKTQVAFKKHFFRDLISGKSAVNKFLKAISKFGYTSYDLS